MSLPFKNQNPRIPLAQKKTLHYGEVITTSGKTLAHHMSMYNQCSRALTLKTYTVAYSTPFVLDTMLGLLSKTFSPWCLFAHSTRTYQLFAIAKLSCLHTVLMFKRMGSGIRLCKFEYQLCVSLAGDNHSNPKYLLIS